MNRLPLAIVLLACAVLLSACDFPGHDDKDKELAGKPCAGAPAQMHTVPTLPAGFPSPAGIRYVALQKDGPTTIATGYLGQTIGPAHQAYDAALKGASGWTITHEEQDVADSEVNFAGHGKSGQVKMVQSCKTRTTVTVTIRPA